MSFQINQNDKKYWVKHCKSMTEVYLTQKGKLSELVLAVNGKASKEDVVKRLG
jgi:hypothetical protein